MKYLILMTALFALNATAAEIVFTPEELQAITGPQGDPGPKGDAGPQGDVGPQGEPGTTITILNGVCSIPGASWDCSGSAPPPPPVEPQCNDNQDNDSDGFVDLADPGCASAQDDDESDDPQPPPPSVAGDYPGVPEYPYRNELPDLDTSADITSCSSNGTSVNGSPGDWVVVTVNQSTRCDISGSYFVIQNSTINHRLNISGGPYAVRSSVVDSTGTGGAVNPSGSNILIEGNVILRNGTIPSSADHHGINVGGSTSGIWILNNEIYENSGDAIQFCHSCVGGSHNGPSSVYIAGNNMHDDEENAIDLKEFLGPVVVVCNKMSGYQSGQFSGNGEAVRLNDEGQQGEAWFSKNTYANNQTDIAAYRSDAESYFLDEVGVLRTNNDPSNSVVANGGAAQPHYAQYESRYGLALGGSCP